MSLAMTEGAAAAIAEIAAALEDCSDRCQTNVLLAGTWAEESFQGAADRLREFRTRLLLGLSAVSTGLDEIERGHVEGGAKCARHGLDYLRGILGEKR